MSELACNIVLYRPNPDLLATKFSYWHAEALLGEAEALMTRCLADYREYCSLDYEWHHFQADLEAQGKKLGLYIQPAGSGLFDRDATAPAPGESEPQGAEVSMEEPEILTLVESVESDEARYQDSEVSGIKSSLDLRVEAVQVKQDLSGPGKPFALNEQRDLALKRLCRDYEAAVDRACVAEDGLKKLYDRTASSAPVPSEAETLGASLSNLAIWIRDSLDWLAAYHRREQAFTRVVSIRSLLNRNAWALLKHARDSYSLKLQIPVDLFRGHANCHLRGVAAALVGEAGIVPWTVILRVPEEAVFERSGQSVEINQGGRAACLLGRVENRRAGRPMEVCCASNLLNASPIGRSTQSGLWSFELVRPAGATSESFAHIEDVLLEIEVAGIPQKIAG